MKKTIAILLVLVSAFSLVFAAGAKEATVTKEVENAVEEIIAEVYKGADYVDLVAKNMDN